MTTLSGKSLSELGSEIRRDIEFDKMSLDLTKDFAALWCAVKKWTQHEGKIPEIQELIRKQAREEWGPETKCEFDSEKNTVTVHNPDGRVEVIEAATHEAAIVAISDET